MRTPRTAGSSSFLFNHSPFTSPTFTASKGSNNFLSLGGVDSDGPRSSLGSRQSLRFQVDTLALQPNPFANLTLPDLPMGAGETARLSDEVTPALADCVRDRLVSRLQENLDATFLGELLMSVSDRVSSVSLIAPCINSM